MTREEMREKVKSCMSEVFYNSTKGGPFPWDSMADAAIALVLEEAAKECMADLPGEGGPMEEGYRLACEENARNIRAMKGKSDD